MRKSAVWVGTIFVLAALPVVAQDVAPGWRHGPGMMWDGGWAWMMFFGPLMMILFVAAVVVLVAFALRWLTGHGPQGPHGVGHPPVSPPGKTPLDILKERFARGEIDKAEFEERRRVLGE
jgi:putative membrane protein